MKRGLVGLRVQESEIQGFNYFTAGDLCQFTCAGSELQRFMFFSAITEETVGPAPFPEICR